MSDISARAADLGCKFGVLESGLIGIGFEIHAPIVTHSSGPPSSQLLRRETDVIRGPWQYRGMAKKAQKQFIKAWRKHRDLTQEQLADRMGIARSYVSHVEGGKRRYDQLFLEAAAVALNCTPADLIMRDPSQPGSIWSIWDQIPSAERDQASKVLETFIKKAS